MFDLIRSIQKRDPASPSFLEVVFAYNGFHAVMWHRMNNWLWQHKLRALARTLANIGRIMTGIEIHPEVKIGEGLFIDHGTGVVIGQTAIIGDNVTIYHGVTLGGIGGATGEKRHPTIEDEAMIGSGAQVLGDITIGRRAKVGANSVVICDVPENATAIGIPARILQGKGTCRAYGMPSREDMDKISGQIDTLVEEVERLKAIVDGQKIKKAA